MSMVVPLNGFSSGANPLNFKVVGNPQPTNPKENTIWLNTDTKVTGYYIQLEQPEDMKFGEVWISIGTSSPVAFNATKKNTVMVYPINAKQMGQDNVLVDVEAKSYQNGEWVDWKNYLYNHGDMCTEITGGWVTRYAANTSSYPKGTVTENADSIRISCGSSTKAAMKHTANAIDFTNIKSISITVTERSGAASNGYNGAWMFLYKNTNTDTVDASEATSKVAITGVGTFTIDTSSVTGSLYVRIESFGATFTFTEVTYEKS